MEKDIGRLTKNPTTEVVIRVDDFGGRPGVTIREFVTSDRYTGFTKAGVRILGTDFKKFKEMINSVEEKDLESTGEVVEKEKPAAKKTAKKVVQEDFEDY